MGYRAYETQTAVNEYLHFHYGPQSVQLQMAVQGASQVTWGFERVLDVCFNHAVGWEHALDVGCAVGGNTFCLELSLSARGRRGHLPRLHPGCLLPAENQISSLHAARPWRALAAVQRRSGESCIGVVA